ncbi:MAG: phosphatidylserine decarboxylase [Tepidisphaera sp.]|nr:phosphatidylserine decarboxylase [Tepidisphaera sp.]
MGPGGSGAAGSGASGLTPDIPSPAIAREGWPIVAGFVIMSVVVSGVAYTALYRVGLERWSYLVMIAGALLSGWCVWFFRDPARRIPSRADAAISPADGVVCKVDEAPLPPELRQAMGEGEDVRPRVCVFMNVFNVHVNRAPVAGRVVCAVHNPGKFFNASFDKASELNERLGLGLRMSDGRTIGCVQIAGLIARRIVCRVREGDDLAAGQRFGLIRFGSRVDVYLPAGSAVLVKVGDRSIAGETVLANISQEA